MFSMFVICTLCDYFKVVKKTLYASRTRCTWTYKCKHTYIHINIYNFLVLLYYGEIKLTSCVFQCYGLTCLHPHHAFKPWHANPLQKGQESPTSAIFYCSRQTLAPSQTDHGLHMSWGRSKQKPLQNTSLVTTSGKCAVVYHAYSMSFDPWTSAFTGAHSQTQSLSAVASWKGLWITCMPPFKPTIK